MAYDQMTADAVSEIADLRAELEERTLERDEARLLLERGVECYMVLSQYIERLGYEIEDGSREWAAVDRFAGLVLDNHIPFSVSGGTKEEEEA